jgi:hypothetical protein
MIKPDEIELANIILSNKEHIYAENYTYKVPYEMWDKLTKRQMYILKKWLDKNWWDCGVTIRSGWLTDEGLVALTEMTNKQEVC